MHQTEQDDDEGAQRSDAMSRLARNSLFGLACLGFHQRPPWVSRVISCPRLATLSRPRLISMEEAGYRTVRNPRQTRGFSCKCGTLISPRCTRTNGRNHDLL
jgi:hypothetical protein